MSIAYLERRPYLVLAVAIAVQVATFVVGQRDLAASDPLWYASIAHRLATDARGVFASHETHPFVMRVGLTAPIALGYLAFGVSTIVTNLPCLLAASGVLAIVYAAAPTPRAKLVGMALACASTPRVVRDANMLNPDLPCAAVMAASILLLSRRDRGPRWVTAAAATLFGAFLIKETALWCAPVWVWAFVRDLRVDGRAATLRRFGPGLTIGAALAIAYVGVCALVWGDSLARFHGVEALAHDHSWSLEGKPAHAWLARLVWEPPVLAFKTFHLMLVPVIAAFVLVRGPARIWLVRGRKRLGVHRLLTVGPQNEHDRSTVRQSIPYA